MEKREKYPKTIKKERKHLFGLNKSSTFVPDYSATGSTKSSLSD